MSEFGYNVLAEYSGQVSEEKAEHITEMLLDALPSAAVSIDRTGVSLRFSIVTDREHFFGQISNEAEGIADNALHSAGLANMRLETLQVQSDAALEREISTPNLPELVGLTEIAEILGVSKQRVAQLRERHDFPKPVVELRSGPVWAKSMLDRFIAQWQRRPGRPPAMDLEDLEDLDPRVLNEALLTQRQREVLALLAAGASSKDVATELEISTEAVRSVTRRILEKLQVHARLETAKLASRSSPSHKVGASTET